MVRVNNTNRPFGLVTEIRTTCPPWVNEIKFKRFYKDERDRMKLAIELSRRNVTEGTGGPFGAAIFNSKTGELISVGVNFVVKSLNPTAHAEMTAYEFACARLGTHSLGELKEQEFDLFTSCEPCEMCMGGANWIGISRLFSAATKGDAKRIGFEEGHVTLGDWNFLEKKLGIKVRRNFMREAAKEVLDAYKASGALVYNGRPQPNGRSR